MSRQKMVWSLAIVAVALVGMVAVPAGATVVTNNMLVYLDAANADGAGNPGTGSQTTWNSLAGTTTNHDGNLFSKGGSIFTPAWVGDGSVANPYSLQFYATSNSYGGEVYLNNGYDSQFGA